MKRVVLIGAVLLLACRTGASTSDSKSGSAEEPRAGDIEACAEALSQSQSVHDHVSACRNLWLNQQCRDAWTEALQSPPGNRGEYVIQKCAEAYCPGLSNPRPALCERSDLAEADLLDEQPDWLTLWTRFNSVVLNEELELEDNDLAAATIARRLLQRVAVSTEPAE